MPSHGPLQLPHFSLPTVLTLSDLNRVMAANPSFFLKFSFITFIQALVQQIFIACLVNAKS